MEEVRQKRRIPSYIFGVLIILLSLPRLTSIPGILAFICGLIIFPPISNLIHNKFNFEIKMWMRVTLIILGLILAFAAIGSQTNSSISTPSSDQDIDKNIFEECEVKQKEIEKDYVGDVFSINKKCLYSKVQTPQDCRNYEGTTIYKWEKETRIFTTEDAQECIYELAIITNDTSLCAQSGSKEKECYTKLAISLQNPEICLQTSDITKCYQAYGVGNCTSLGYGSTIVACVYDRLEINKESIKIEDTTVCEVWESFNNQNEKNSLCVSGIGTYLKDITICNQAGIYKPDCYSAIARSNPQFTLQECDKAGVDYIGCYISIAIRDQNPSICSKIPESRKDDCIGQIAITTKNLPMCAQIQGAGGLQCAQKFVQMINKEEYTIQFCDAIKQIGPGTGGPSPNQCYYEVATRTLDSAVCQKIEGENNAKEECITIIQHALNK